MKIGHNRGEETLIQVEVRLFNTLTRFGNKGRYPHHLELPADACVGDILGRLGVPRDDVYLVLRNGRDVTPWLNGGINEEAWLDDGDVIALSGPVPYSWGYGAPIV